MLFLRQELGIYPIGVEVSLILHPLSLWLFCRRVGAATGFSRGRVCLTVISQLREDVSPRLAVLVPHIPAFINNIKDYVIAIAMQLRCIT